MADTMTAHNAPQSIGGRVCGVVLGGGGKPNGGRAWSRGAALPGRPGCTRPHWMHQRIRTCLRPRATAPTVVNGAGLIVVWGGCINPNPPPC